MIATKKKNNPFTSRDIISIKEFNQQEILHILEHAKSYKKQTPGPILQGFIMGVYFCEPSTRTRLSFEGAMKRLGGEVIGFSDTKSSSMQKGESLRDSIKMLGNYSDVIIIRHHLEGAARHAAESTDKPIINGGDGGNEHPTQTLLDLFTIQECQGRLKDIHIAMVGDLKYGRTVHSLAHAGSLFNMHLYFVSPESLRMPEDICRELRRRGAQFSQHTALEEVIDKVDILYMTRIQEERFANKLEYKKLKGSFRLKSSDLTNAKESLKILHPLPRLQEINPELDVSPHAYYFEQAQNGLYVRQALLALLLRNPTVEEGGT